MIKGIGGLGLGAWDLGLGAWGLVACSAVPLTYEEGHIVRETDSVGDMSQS